MVSDHLNGASIQNTLAQVAVPHGNWDTVAGLLSKYREAGASDLHLVEGRRGYARIDGDLTETFPGASSEEIANFLHDCTTPYQFERLQNSWSTDSATSDPSFGRIRIHAAQTNTGVALVLRFLKDEAPDFSSLDLPEQIAAWTRRPSGLILFSGVTGSGKTTLQSSLSRYMLDHINPVIWTLEDPIEYLFSHDDRIHQRELGRHFTSFDLGIQDAMREDPDVIITGEIRSPETAAAALAAAESGHIVMGTIHTSETSRVPDRLLGMFPENSRDLIRVQLASTLIGVVGMKLVKYGPEFMRKNPGLTNGRRAAVEILINNDQVSGAIQANKTKSIRDAVTQGVSIGMLSLEYHLRQLVERGHITKDEANAAAEHPSELPLGSKGALI